MKTTLLYKALVCVAMVAGTSSCVNNWLDQEPSTGVDAGSAVTTTSDLTSVRAGFYAALKGNSSRPTTTDARCSYMETSGERTCSTTGLTAAAAATSIIT